MASEFKEGVVRVVKMIPKGKVASYGQVALYVGIPRAARQVGWILRGLDRKTEVPWWRVVNNEGRISIKHSKFNAQEQAQLLREEGVEVDNELNLEIEKYRLRPGKVFIDKLKLDPLYLASVALKIPYSNN